jgi:hypothetical protein
MEGWVLVIANLSPFTSRDGPWGLIASEQAINRLSDAGTGIPLEQGINREVSARASEATRSARSMTDIRARCHATACVADGKI